MKSSNIGNFFNIKDKKRLLNRILGNLKSDNTSPRDKKVRFRICRDIKEYFNCPFYYLKNLIIYNKKKFRLLFLAASVYLLLIFLVDYFLFKMAHNMENEYLYFFIIIFVIPSITLILSIPIISSYSFFAKMAKSYDLLKSKTPSSVLKLIENLRKQDRSINEYEKKLLNEFKIEKNIISIFKDNLNVASGIFLAFLIYISAFTVYVFGVLKLLDLRDYMISHHLSDFYLILIISSFLFGVMILIHLFYFLPTVLGYALLSTSFKEAFIKSFYFFNLKYLMEHFTAEYVVYFFIILGMSVLELILIFFLILFPVYFTIIYIAIFYPLTLLKVLYFITSIDKRIWYKIEEEEKNKREFVFS
ncbi:MAG: hypothetical protein DSY66_03805 [Persephonella sp.]|nr:MAG: hypothetical protein DSY66_03805 [Persephonella sp.]